MAVKFFWRCEATTLTAGVDYSAADMTATASGAPTIAAGGARVGTNGIVTTDASDWYYFDPTSIVATAEGAVAFSIRFPVAVPASGYDFGVRVIDAGGTNYLSVRTAGASTGFSFRLARNGSTKTVTTSGVTIDANTWYGIVVRWDIAGDRVRIEIYDEVNSLIGAAEDLATDLAAYEPAGPFATYGFQIGNMSSQTNVCHIDNVFVADDYDEPLQNNFGISDIDDYDSSIGTRYLKLLAEAAAASDTAVEGRVFNGDDYIGKFTGQAWEADLESGEAVLLVAVADITPDGATLTTSDTPTVFAYNATDATTGPGDATVIEV